MYIESHLIEGSLGLATNDTVVADVVPNEEKYVEPVFDSTIIDTSAEVRTPSSECLRCAYNAFADSLGCVSSFGLCPYLVR